MTQELTSTPKKKYAETCLTPSLVTRPSVYFKKSNKNFCNVRLSDNCNKIINNPIFQRLRRVAQLGPSQYVFPSATHTRFEHSLGVAQLGFLLVAHINEVQVNMRKPLAEDEITTDNDVRLVEVAGLCHDLGHGPYSHLYERVMKRKGFSFSHEKMSSLLFRKIVDENELDFTDEDIDIIDSMITDHKGQTASWRRQIVSNGENGIDVDRLDYIRRDSHHLNIKTKFSVDDIIESAFLVGGKICFDHECKGCIEEFFANRYKLYKEVYTGKEVTGVELLFSDILSEAFPYIPNMTTDPMRDLDSFIKLDDTLINPIRYTEDVRLKKAKELVHRVDSGEFYQFINAIEETHENESTLERLTEEELVACGNGLNIDDIIVNTQHIRVAKECNWNCIPFVEDADSTEIFYDTPSILYPTKHETVTKRVYARNLQKADLIRSAIKQFVTKNGMELSIIEK